MILSNNSKVNKLTHLYVLRQYTSQHILSIWSDNVIRISLEMWYNLSIYNFKLKFAEYVAHT